MIEGALRVTVLLLPVAGVAAGLAWAGWRRHADPAALVCWGAGGGLVGGVLAQLLATVVPGDWRGFALLGVHVLAPMVGAVAGVVVAVLVWAWRFLRLASRRRGAG